MSTINLGNFGFLILLIGTLYLLEQLMQSVAVGTAAIAEDGSVASPGDVYGQAKRCLEIIEKAIKQAGGSLKDTVRTRIFLKDMNTWKQAAKAHGEFFSDIQPACTFVEVNRFINPEWLIEIEADAVLES